MSELQKPNRPDRPTGAITLDTIASAIGALLPENAIVIDESVTTGRGFLPFTAGAAPARVRAAEPLGNNAAGLAADSAADPGEWPERVPGPVLAAGLGGALELAGAAER